MQSLFFTVVLKFVLVIQLNLHEMNKKLIKNKYGDYSTLKKGVILT